MKFGVCALSAIAIRRKPSHTAEMTSQLLFGETYTVLEEMDLWIKITCNWDDFEGWIEEKQFHEISEKDVGKISEQKAHSYEISQNANNNHYFLPILMGASLPLFDGMSFKLNSKRYTYSGQVIQSENIKPSPELIEKIARRYLYSPYMWGGRSPFGIDASGFTQMVFKFVNIKLRRNSNQQARQGKLVGFIHEILPGDLAFFENSKGKVNHVGIVLPEHKIIHVSGCVRIDKIDQYGIYNEESKQYTHKLRVFKRHLK